MRRYDERDTLAERHADRRGHAGAAAGGGGAAAGFHRRRARSNTTPRVRSRRCGPPCARRWTISGAMCHRGRWADGSAVAAARRHGGGAGRPAHGAARARAARAGGRRARRSARRARAPDRAHPDRRRGRVRPGTAHRRRLLRSRVPGHGPGGRRWRRAATALVEGYREAGGDAGDRALLASMARYRALVRARSTGCPVATAASGPRSGCSRPSNSDGGGARPQLSRRMRSAGQWQEHAGAGALRPERHGPHLVRRGAQGAGRPGAERAAPAAATGARRLSARIASSAGMRQRL
jgi:hypothetical protein